MHTPFLGNRERRVPTRSEGAEVEQREARRHTVHYKRRRDLLETKIEEYIDSYR